MRFAPLAFVAVCAASLVAATPAFADTFTVFSTPTSTYVADTTNYGGGNGSESFTNGVGPFTFSSSLDQLTVPNTWNNWGSPPNTQSPDPNVLYDQSGTTLLLTLAPGSNVAGFEMEADDFGTYSFNVSFYDEHGVLIDTITQSPTTGYPNGGALQFALEDTTPGQTIGSIQIGAPTGGFAIAQLSAGDIASTPEPSSLVMLGTGLIGIAGMARRRLNPVQA